MLMRPFLVLCWALCWVVSPAIADTCRDEIAALHDGGALDPFERPPHRFDTVVTGADGGLRWEMHTVFDTPLRSISGLRGGTFTLMIDDRTWIGPGPDGPWTEAPNHNPADMAAFHRKTRDQQAANLRDTACLGLVERDGQSLLAYRFTTQTDPDPDQGGSYFGATYTAFVGAGLGRLVRLEQRGQFSHFQPESGTDTWVSTYSYDPDIRLVPPR